MTVPSWDDTGVVELESVYIPPSVPPTDQVIEEKRLPTFVDTKQHITIQYLKVEKQQNEKVEENREIVGTKKYAACVWICDGEGGRIEENARSIASDGE